VKRAGVGGKGSHGGATFHSCGGGQVGPFTATQRMKLKEVRNLKAKTKNEGGRKGPTGGRVEGPEIVGYVRGEGGCRCH